MMMINNNTASVDIATEMLQCQCQFKYICYNIVHTLVLHVVPNCYCAIMVR